MGRLSSENEYDDPRVASVYDALNPWGPGDDHYLALIGSARSVLDLGCGTGQLLRRAAAEGVGGELVGVDDASAMLAVAARDDAPVTWLRGDARTVDLARRFELVVMTGHTFQIFLTDDDVRALLANVRRHLEPEGRFAFETRNPHHRPWERWEGMRSAVDGVEVEYGRVRTIPPDLVEFTGSLRIPDSSEAVVGTSTLRFVEPDHLRTLIEQGGFRIDGWFGDWDRTPVTPSSPEIVVVAA